ncbi:MAG: PQQ-binding-like beta-propeller repeat protein [Dongiaceae bacterium]
MRFIFLIALVVLTACSSLEFLGEGPPPPLPGERIAILKGNNQLLADPALAGIAVQLPDPFLNTAWPQAGGYPNHMMGHLSLGGGLRQLWKVDAGRGNDKQYILAAPIADQGRIFTIDVEAKAYALSLQEGKKLWVADLAPPKGGRAEIGGGGLALDGESLIATTGYGEVIALDVNDGKILWRKQVNSPIRAAPTITNGRILVITVDNRTLALSSKDGATLWTHEGINEPVTLLGAASAAADEGIFVVPYSSGELFGLRQDTGRVLWSDSLISPRRSNQLASLGAISGLPVLDKGLVVAIGHGGRMLGLEAKTGGRVWDQELGGTETPWVAGDFIFVQGSDGILRCILRRDGRVRWASLLPQGKDKDKPILYSGPILAGGKLFSVSSKGDLMMIDPYTGQIMGKHDIGEPVLIPPIVVNNTLLLLSVKGNLIALR